MREFLKKIAFLVLASIITIGLLSFAHVFLYKLIPTDFNRHLVLNKVLKDSTKGENVIIFGNSRAMFGIDAKLLKKDTDFPGEIYNLSSVGQSFYESSYYYDMVDSTTNIVVQCVSPGFFSRNIPHYLKFETATSMFLSGYRVSNETKKLIPQYNPFFDNQNAHNYLKARPYYKSYIHNLIRKIFDNEKFDESKRLDEFFPHIYTTAKHPNYPVYAKNCIPYEQREKASSQIVFIKAVKKHFEKKDVKFVILLMPINPDECDLFYPNFERTAELIIRETGVSVLNCGSEVKESKYFYDAKHLNKKGAKFLTEKLALDFRKL